MIRRKKIIKLIYGIGNEEKKFEGTRHNIGKEIIKNFIKEPEFLNFAYVQKIDSLILATNKNYVNQSGQGLKELVKKFKIKPEEILIIHDDADIIFPLFKISFNVSSAGHRGVESIIKNLKTKNFWRMRIGIQNKKRLPAEKIVLEKFSKTEKNTIEKIKEKFKIILELLKERMPNELNISKDYFLQ